MTVDSQEFPATTNKLIQAAAGKSMCLDVLQAEERWSHRRGNYAGVNMLYSDGSVDFRRNPEVLSTSADMSSDPMEDFAGFRTMIQELE